MKPNISIIVPVFNVEKYLNRCLDSLLSQSLANIEIICVNDGSTDGSSNILYEYSQRDSRITIINQRNSGVSIARNNGLKHVRGEYFMFVDSDDWLDIETCEVIYAYASNYTADCLMFSYTKEFAGHSLANHIFTEKMLVWDETDIQTKLHRRLFGPIGDELSSPQSLDIIVSSCGQLFLTEKFVDIKFVDIRDIGTFEDGLYQMAVYKDCNKFIYLDKPYYHYLKTNDVSITTKYKSDLFEKWQNLYKIIQDYITSWGLPEVYYKALNNRIAIGVLSLGLNQARSNDNIFRGAKHLTQIIQTPIYKTALYELDTSKMPFHWRVFFQLAKFRFTIILFPLLKFIEFLRTHKK